MNTHDIWKLDDIIKALTDARDAHGNVEVRVIAEDDAIAKAVDKVLPIYGFNLLMRDCKYVLLITENP